MKRNFIKEYFKAVVAAVFAVATISACEKSTAESGESYDSKIFLTESIVKVEAAESVFTVTFNVSGTHTVEDVTAEVGSDWLSIAVESEESTSASTVTKSTGVTPVYRSLKFKAAANKSDGSRTGSVTFKLDGAKDVKCTVIQAADPDYVVNNQMTFSLDVTDIEESSVKFTVAPSISDAYYFYAFVKKSVYDSYGGNYVSMSVKEMQDYAKKYKEEYEKEFDLKSHLYKSYISATATGLDPDTDYCLVAFDMTLGYGYSGNVAVHKFKTKAVPPSSDAFTVTYDEAAGNVMFTPAETTTGSFSFGVAPLSVWEEAKAPSVLVSNYISNSSSLPVYNASDGARGLPISRYSDIVDDTDYVAFAFSYNQTTGKASNISWLKFHFNK